MTTYTLDQIDRYIAQAERQLASLYGAPSGTVAWLYDLRQKRAALTSTLV